MADKKQPEEEVKKTEAEIEMDKKKAELQKAALLDNNINPLLNNGITNRDIFRTLLFHFKTDNVIPIDKAAEFVVNLLKRPVVTVYDQEAEQRFLASLKKIMMSYSGGAQELNEDQFCELMQSFEVQNEYEFSDQQQYDMFLDRLFYRIKH